MGKGLRLEDLEVYKVARNLITEEEFALLTQKFDLYFRLSFGYINSIGNTSLNEAG